MLNSVSRVRSAVGRVDSPLGATSLRPRHWPATILTGGPSPPGSRLEQGTEPVKVTLADFRHLAARQVAPVVEHGLEGLDALLAQGSAAESEAVDYYRFTSDLKRTLDETQRQQLIGILWDIVYADGSRSEMEDHAIWRVADLLGVSGRERIVQRQEAAERAGLGAIDDAK